MFKKRDRLSVAEFTTYFKTGARHHTKHLTFIVTPAASRKVSVVVGKKVSKRAVTRNMLRRRIYAILRETLPADFTGVLIVLVKPSFATLPRKTAHSFMVESIAALIKST